MSDTQHYSSGVERDRVNEQLGGGFPSHSLMLVEGEDGAGKSTLTQRLAYGFANQGHEVTYVSTEIDASGFLEQMSSLSYDAVDMLIDDSIRFLQADTDTHSVDGQAYAERELLPRLADSAEMWRKDIIIFDAFSDFLRNDPWFDESTDYNDEDHAMQNLLDFFRMITKQGKLVILTVDDEGLSSKGLRPLRQSADIYFDLQVDQIAGDRKQTIAVKRFLEMKGQVDDTIGFTVQQGRGISIQTQTVA